MKKGTNGTLTGQLEVNRGQLDGQVEVRGGHERSLDFKKKRCFSYSKSTDDDFDVDR